MWQDDPAMIHERYLIDGLSASGDAVPTTGGTLLVVYRPNSNIDWELVHRSSDHVELAQQPYELVMTCPGGDLTGTAILVRSDGISHVFRGAGDLRFDGEVLVAPEV